MKPRIKYPRLKPRDFAPARDLAALVGEFIQYWGFKAVHGRIWCYLYLSRMPLNSRELAQLAEVSPALITQSIQILLDYRVIQDAGKGPNGMRLFRANPDPAEAIREVLTQRESRLLRGVGQAAQRLETAGKRKRPASPIEIDPARSADIVQWVGLATQVLESGLACLQKGGPELLL